MKDSKNVLVFILILIIIGGIVFYFFNNKESKENVSNTNNINITNNISDNNIVAENTTVNNDLKIDEILLENAVKNALIEEIAKKQRDWSEEEGTYAEGHKILKSEIKDNKVYAYVVAEIGKFKMVNGEVDPVSASAGPMKIIFDIDSNGEYKFVEYLEPKELTDDKKWEEELKAIFPVDLVSEAKVDYSTSFYKDQIKKYL